MRSQIKHILLDLRQELSDLLRQIFDIAADLLAGIAADDYALALRDISGPISMPGVPLIS